MFGGALRLQAASTLEMSNGIAFTGNTAGVVGGAIALFFSALWKSDANIVTFTENTAERGSAVYFRGLQSSTEVLHDLLFTHNEALVGGTVFWLADSSMTAEPKGLDQPSVVWEGNTAVQYGPEVATQAVTVLGPTG